MFSKIISCLILTTFLTTSVVPPDYARAQMVPDLPVPGTMITATPTYVPVEMKGLMIHPENPLAFEFIMDTGDTGFGVGSELKEESEKLIKYFLAALTVPEDQVWVNLSPYEKDRIVADSLGQTEMGRDLLAQDYMLKQLTSSLMYPEDELGGQFWARVYERAQELYGTTDIPLNTFNKIWIVPNDAQVYEKDGTAYIVHSSLKVMLEEDYVALAKNQGLSQFGLDSAADDDSKMISKAQSEVIKTVLIPEIEREVNQGRTFARLRQIYDAMILATWYKIRAKESLLGQIYVDQNKTDGIMQEDSAVNERIWAQYVESFQKGVFDLIQEDYDPATQSVVPRKYFSGGVAFKSDRGSLAKIMTFVVAGAIGFFAFMSDISAVSTGGTMFEVTTQFATPADAPVVEDLKPAIIPEHFQFQEEEAAVPGIDSNPPDSVIWASTNVSGLQVYQNGNGGTIVNFEQDTLNPQVFRNADGFQIEVEGYEQAELDVGIPMLPSSIPNITINPNQIMIGTSGETTIQTIKYSTMNLTVTLGGDSLTLGGVSYVSVNRNGDLVIATQNALDWRDMTKAGFMTFYKIPKGESLTLENLNNGYFNVGKQFITAWNTYQAASQDKKKRKDLPPDGLRRSKSQGLYKLNDTIVALVDPDGTIRMFNGIYTDDGSIFEIGGKDYLFDSNGNIAEINMAMLSAQERRLLRFVITPMLVLGMMVAMTANAGAQTDSLVVKDYSGVRLDTFLNGKVLRTTTASDGTPSFTLIPSEVKPLNGVRKLPVVNPAEQNEKKKDKNNAMLSATVGYMIFLIMFLAQTFGFPEARVSQIAEDINKEIFVDSGRDTLLPGIDTIRLLYKTKQGNIPYFLNTPIIKSSPRDSLDQEIMPIDTVIINEPLAQDRNNSLRHSAAMLNFQQFIYRSIFFLVLLQGCRTPEQPVQPGQFYYNYDH